MTQNPKHWSNEVETLKLIKEFIVPYVVKKRAELKLAEDQKILALLVNVPQVISPTFIIQPPGYRWT